MPVCNTVINVYVYIIYYHDITSSVGDLTFDFETRVPRERNFARPDVHEKRPGKILAFTEYII